MHLFVKIFTCSYVGIFEYSCKYCVQYLYNHSHYIKSTFSNAYRYPIDIRCEDLSAPANGEIFSCSSGIVGVGYEGDTCSFTCNTGYELTGSDTRTCQSNGSWSGDDVVCIGNV